MPARAQRDCHMERLTGVSTVGIYHAAGRSCHAGKVTLNEKLRRRRRRCRCHLEWTLERTAHENWAALIKIGHHAWIHVALAELTLIVRPCGHNGDVGE